MANIKDLRPITPRINRTRALSAIKNITRHHSAITSGNGNHSGDTGTVQTAGGLAATTKSYFAMEQWSCAMIRPKLQMA